MKSNTTTVFTWTVGRAKGDGSSKICKSEAKVNVTNTFYEAKLISSDVTVCDSDTSLTLAAYSVQESAARGWWTSNGVELTSNSTATEAITVTGFSHGSTRYTWNVQKGNCDTKTADVTVTNSEVTSNPPANFTVCVENNIKLEADNRDLDNNAHGEWIKNFSDPENKITIANSTSYSTTVSGLSGDAYEFKWVVRSDDKKCKAENIVEITDNSFTTSILNVVDHKRNVCGSNDITIQATQPKGTGEWTIPEGVTIVEGNISTNKIVVSGISDKAKFVWTEKRGATPQTTCSATDYVTLTNRKPQLNVEPDYYTCDGDVELHATLNKEGEVGTWSKEANSYSGYFGSSDSKLSSVVQDGTATVYHGVDANSSIVLRWTVSDNVMPECSNYETVTVRSYKYNPVIKIDETDVCGDDVYSISGTMPETGFVGTWTSTLGSSVEFGVSTSSATTFTGLARGDNELTWTVSDISGKCKENKASVIIHNNAPTKAEINNSRTKEGTQTCDGSIVLKAADIATGETYQWSNASGTITYSDGSGTSQNVTASGISPNSHVTFTLTVKNGSCTSKDTITIFSNEVKAIAGTVDESCDGTATLSATDPSTLAYKGSGYWTTTSDDVEFVTASTNASAQISNLPSGTTTMIWNVEKGKCNDSKNVLITNNSVKAEITNVPFDENGQQKIYSCSDYEYLSANNLEGTGATGRWEKGTPLDVVTFESTSNRVRVSNFNTNNNYVLWTVTKGRCQESASVNIISNVVHTSITGVDENGVIYTCEDNKKLSAVLPSGCTGKWTLQKGTVDIIGNTAETSIGLMNLPYNDDVQLSWKVTSTTNTKCYDEKFVTIRSSKVTASVDRAEITTCNGQALINGNALSDATCYWRHATTSNKGIFDNSSAAETYVTNIKKETAEKYFWHVEKAAGSHICSAEAEVMVKNYQYEISAGKYDNNPICDGNVYLSPTPTSNGIGYWTVDSGEGSVENSTVHNTKLTMLPGAAVNLTWHFNRHNCEESAPVTIKNDQIVASAEDLVTCDDSKALSATAVDTENGEEGYWTCATLGVLMDGATSASNAKAYATNLKKGNNSFTWHVKNAAGCTSTATINVNYLEPDASLPHSELNICSSSTSLTASNDPTRSGYTGEWRVLEGSASIANKTNWKTIVSDLKRGTTTKIGWFVKSKANCEGSAIISITNNAPEVVASDVTECGDKGILGATNPTASTSHGSWKLHKSNVYSEFSFADITNGQTKYSGARRGSTVLVWTVTDDLTGCTDSVDVTVTNSDFVVSAGNTSDIDSCSYEVALSGTPLEKGDIGYWEASDPNSTIVFKNSTNNITTVTGLRYGANSVKWTINRGGNCTRVGYVTINSRVYPGFTAGDDDTVCVSTVQLAASNPASYEDEKDLYKVKSQWRVETGIGLQFTNSTNYGSKVKGLNIGTSVLKWTVDNGSCVQEATIKIVNNGVVADAQVGKGTIKLCEDYYKFFANMPAQYDSVRWDAIYGGGQFNVRRTHNNALYTSSTATNMYSDRCDSTTVNGINQGVNTYVWNVFNKGCHTSDTVYIKNLAPSKAQTMASEPICKNEYHLSANSPRIGTGVWSKSTEDAPAKIVNSTANYTEVTNLGTGENKFYWTITNVQDGKVCVSKAEVVLDNQAMSVSAGTDFVSCEDEVILQAADPGAFEGYWIPVTKLVNGGKIESTASFKTKVTGLRVGGNTFRWTKKNEKCSVFDEVTVTVNKPTVAKAGDDFPVCLDNTSLTGNTPDIDERGEWTSLNGDIIIKNSTAISTKVSNLSGGKNTFVWRITRGEGEAACFSTDTLVVTSMKITMSVTSDKREYCEDHGNVSGHVNVDNYTSIWRPVGGDAVFTNSTANNTAVTNLQEGTNTLRWIVTVPMNDGSGRSCEAYDDVTVINNTAPQALVSTEPIPTCLKETSITANVPPQGTTGEWRIIQGTGKIIPSTSYNAVVTGLASDYNYLGWKIKKGSCESEATLTVISSPINTQVSGTDGKDTLYICGTETEINGAPADADGEGWWTTTSRSAHFLDDLSTAAQANIYNVTPGAHTFVWHVKNAIGCETSANLTVMNSLYPATARLATANPICSGEATIIGNVPSGEAKGYWVHPETAEVTDPTSAVTTLKPGVIGLNTVYWKVEKNGCINSASVDVYNYTVQANVGETVTACGEDEVKTIMAQKPPEGGYGEWTNPNGHVEIINSTANVTSVTHIQQGANVVKWTVFSKEFAIPNGSTTRCSASDEIIVNNNKFETNAGTDFEVCDTMAPIAAQFHGTRAKGYWSGGRFENSTSYRTKVYGLRNSTPTTLTWTVEMNGCVATADVVVKNVHVDIDILSGSKTTCTPYTNLQATQSEGTGQWKITDGTGDIIPSTANIAEVHGLRKGPNKIRWIVRNGNQITCETFKEVIVNNATIDITAGANQTTCDTFAILAGTPPAENQIGYWSLGSVASRPVSYYGAGPSVENSTLYNSRVSGLYYDRDGNGYSNTFTWFVQDLKTNCTAEATVDIKTFHFDTDADTTTLKNVKQTLKNSIEITPRVMSNYTGRWVPSIGGGSAQSLNDPMKPATYKISGLSQGINEWMWIAKLKGTFDENNTLLTPQCEARSIVTINYIAFKVEAGTDMTICSEKQDGPIVLEAEEIEGAAAYWTSGSNGVAKFSDSTKANTVVYNLSRGRNVLYWNVVKNGFRAMDSVVIYNVDFDVYAGADQYLCEDTTTIRARGPLNNPILEEADRVLSVSGYWDTPIGGVKYENNKSTTTKITGIKPMANTLVWHGIVDVKADTPDLQGIGMKRCYADDTVKVTYYVAPEPDFTIEPRTASGCSPFEVKIANTTYNTYKEEEVFYRWNFGNIISYDTEDHNSIITQTFHNEGYKDTVYTIWLTSNVKIPGDVCRTTDSMQVTVYPVPKAHIDVARLTYKQPNMKVSMFADSIPGADVRYSWNYGDNSGDVWKDNTDFKKTQIHEYATYGKYTIVLDVNNKHCSTSDTAKITIEPAAPTKTIGAKSNTGCNPTLHELVEGVNFADSVRWDIYDVTDSTVLQASFVVPDGQNGTYLFNKVGKYYMYQYAYGPGVKGEAYMRTDTMIIYPTPIAEFSTRPDTVRLPNIPLFTSNTSVGAVTYKWDFGDGVTSDEMEPTHYYTTAGDFYVNLKVTSEHNCSAEASERHVRVEPEGMLRFPTAFVPNPAGPCGGVETKFHNYVFLPYPRNGVKEGTYTLEIFNRYGEKIYESHDPNIGWDGYYRGELCKQDVYVFKCRCTFENGKIFKQIGNVTLLR